MLGRLALSRIAEAVSEIACFEAHSVRDQSACRPQSHGGPAEGFTDRDFRHLDPVINDLQLIVIEDDHVKRLGFAGLELRQVCGFRGGEVLLEEGQKILAARALRISEVTDAQGDLAFRWLHLGRGKDRREEIN